MSVLIGHASIDERGRAYGGSAGDQTGGEVCIRSWWARGWNVCLRFKDPKKAELAATFVEECCRGGMVGYDQWQRNTLRDAARAAGWIGKDIKTKCETDCAAFMTVAAEAAGIDVSCCYLQLASGGWNAPITPTMRAKFAATGAFDVLTASKYLTSDKYLKRGDILVREDAHTVMVLSNGIYAGGTDESENKEKEDTIMIEVQRISKGSSGSAVAMAQGILRGFGFTDNAGGVITVDRVFGAKTEQATIKLQKKLFPGDSSQWDGIWGTRTWTAAAAYKG